MPEVDAMIDPKDYQAALDEAAEFRAQYEHALAEVTRLQRELDTLGGQHGELRAQAARERQPTAEHVLDMARKIVEDRAPTDAALDALHAELADAHARIDRQQHAHEERAGRLMDELKARTADQERFVAEVRRVALEAGVPPERLAAIKDPCDFGPVGVTDE